jgi:hypothetical protein
MSVGKNYIITLSLISNFLKFGVKIFTTTRHIFSLNKAFLKAHFNLEQGKNTLNTEMYLKCIPEYDYQP